MTDFADLPPYKFIVRQLTRGLVIPFLGAGANVTLSNAGSRFEPGRRLPSGRELAEHLADEFGYSDEDGRNDLLHVSQWVSTIIGLNTLYDALHTLFDRDYVPTLIHQVLAEVPRHVREHDGGQPLIITTNYDDALERAHRDRGEPFDLLTYIALGRDQGHFRLLTAEGDERVIRSATKSKLVLLQDRPVLLKIPEAVMRNTREPARDSYVMTEDDYIDLLVRSDVDQLLPSSVVDRMQRSHYLFLGYSLGDWNLRAMLQRIRRDRALANRSRVIQHKPKPLDEKVWQDRNLLTYDLTVEDFAAELRLWLAAAGRQEVPA